jgi:hypothetical protein
VKLTNSETAIKIIFGWDFAVNISGKMDKWYKFIKSQRRKINVSD